MKRHIETLVLIALLGVAGSSRASEFMEDFESYVAGSTMHGQGGWKGWDNVTAVDALVSNLYASGGRNSVEILAITDLVHEFSLTGGRWVVTAMQYIPSGAAGTTYFILLNTYNDGGPYDWSVQTECDLDAGTIDFWHGGTAQIRYDQWVELKYVIDLDNNTVDKYYNGQFIVTDQWDDDEHGTLAAIDLYGNGASSVFYDNIKIESLSGGGGGGGSRAYGAADSAPANAVYVDTAGNVGIGTTSPTNILTVVSPSGGDGIAVVDNTGNTKGLMSIAGGDWGFLELYNSSGRGVYINPLSSYFQGKVGIGTTIPDEELTVEGTIKASTKDQGDATSWPLGDPGGPRGTAIYGVASRLYGKGVHGEATGQQGKGVCGKASGRPYGVGVYGMASNYLGIGVYGMASGEAGTGIRGVASGEARYAGEFSGDVRIAGHLSVNHVSKGSGSFKIDHPLDPENKYLQHSFVESPDMMNIYNGNVTLDEDGQAVVQLPEYFEALNCDFRYQLTPIGAPGPNLYIAEKISENRFEIAGGKPGMEVSWQVTGIRHDPYAVANPIQVEEDKPAEERGYYLHPKAYRLPEERGIETVRRPRPSQTQEVARKGLSYESNKH